MNKFFFFSLILFLTYSCTQKHQHTTQELLSKELNEVYREGQFNGYSVAIVNEHRTLYKRGVGYANVATKQAYTEHTLQNIGSISKTLVGIALLKAQELGKLKLDDPINNYLPFKVNNPYYPATPIRIRHLATHTSTIKDGEVYLKRNYVLKPNQDLSNVKLALEDEQIINPYDSLISMKSFLQNTLSADGKWYKKEDFLTQKPGELFEYSNIATALAAAIIENATGESFYEFMTKYILKPLKMKHSGWRFADIDISKHSRLYYTPDTLLPYYSLITYPDGNFITSSSDLANYLRELIKGYSGKGTILSRESFQTYFSEQLSAQNYHERNEKNPYNDEYNIGIFIGFSAAGNIGHTGGDPGIASMMFFNPKDKIGKILIVNTNINDKKGSNQFYKIWNTLDKYQSQL